MSFGIFGTFFIITNVCSLSKQIFWKHSPRFNIALIESLSRFTSSVLKTIYELISVDHRNIKIGQT